MSLPQNIEPAKPVEEQTAVSEETVAEEPVVSESDTSGEDTTAEDASDAQLRQWAKDNGIDGVPASGRLSATWRDQISAAMAAALNDMATALDPKDEDSAEDTSSESSIPVEEETTSETEDATDESDPEEEVEVVPVAPEFETGTYRSVFKAPNTFVSSQAFTA